MLFKDRLDALCKEFNIMEASVVTLDHQEDKLKYHQYINVSDKEYQFFADGDTPSNFDTQHSLSNPKKVVINYYNAQINDQLVVRNNGDVAFICFFKDFIELGGQRFVEKYIDKHCIFKDAHITVGVGDKMLQI